MATSKLTDHRMTHRRVVVLDLHQELMRDLNGGQYAGSKSLTLQAVTLLEQCQQMKRKFLLKTTSVKQPRK